VRGGRQLGSDDPSEHSSSRNTSSGRKSSSRRGPAKKFATLGDLASSGGRDSGNEDDENQDLFAGGEKSALAVQNPDDIKQKILEKAMRYDFPPFIKLLLLTFISEPSHPGLMNRKHENPILLDLPALLEATIRQAR
jgi:hypothetical protein